MAREHSRCLFNQLQGSRAKGLDFRGSCVESRRLVKTSVISGTLGICGECRGIMEVLVSML